MDNRNNNVEKWKQIVLSQLSNHSLRLKHYSMLFQSELNHSLQQMILTNQKINFIIHQQHDASLPKNWFIIASAATEEDTVETRRYKLNSLVSIIKNKNS